MNNSDFINKWLSLMFRIIKRSRGYEYKITTEGFMSRHLFSLDNPAEQLSLVHFFRILVNWAMICTLSEDQDEFMSNWIRLGEKIRDFANSRHADHFNNLFNPHH